MFNLSKFKMNQTSFKILNGNPKFCFMYKTISRRPKTWAEGARNMEHSMLCLKGGEKVDSKQDKGFFRAIFLDLFMIIFVRAF